MLCLLVIRHVTRVADVKEDALEAIYEKRLRKKSVEKEKEESGVKIDPVDALPVKTLDGKLYYRTCIELFIAPFCQVGCFHSLITCIDCGNNEWFVLLIM